MNIPLNFGGGVPKTIFKDREIKEYFDEAGYVNKEVDETDLSIFDKVAESLDTSEPEVTSSPTPSSPLSDDVVVKHITIFDKVESVMEGNKSVLSDSATDEYKMLNIFNNVPETTLSFVCFVSIISGIYAGDFSISEIVEFLNTNQLDYSIASLWEFLRGFNREEEKIKILKSRLFNRDHLEYGNIYYFLNDLISKIPLPGDPVIFLKDIKEKNEWKDYILSPKISYINTTSAYSNIYKAEDAYWDILDQITAPSSLQINISKNLIKALKPVDRLSGVPVLMKKAIQKSKFSSNPEIQRFIASLFNEDYKGLFQSEVYDLIDNMVKEAVKYFDNQNTPYDFFNDSSLPDLKSFVEAKVDELESLSLADITLEKNKEIKFYINVVCPFLDIETESTLIETISNDIVSEFVILEGFLNNLRTQLLLQGHFTENKE